MYNSTEHNSSELTSWEKLLYFTYKYQSLLSISFLILFISLTSYFGFYKYQEYRNEEAQNKIYHAVYDFENYQFNTALEGGKDYLGFLKIIEQYPYTATANLARMYVGIILLNQKNYAKAILYLEGCSFKESILESQRYSLLGDVYTEKMHYTEAIKYYQKASKVKKNKYFTPLYMLKSALVYEKMQQLQKAFNMYQKIIVDFPKSMYEEEANRHIGRLQHLVMKNKRNEYSNKET